VADEQIKTVDGLVEPPVVHIGGGGAAAVVFVAVL